MTRAWVAVLFVMGCGTEAPPTPRAQPPMVPTEGPLTPPPEPSTADGKPLTAVVDPTREVAPQDLLATPPQTSVTVSGFLVSTDERSTVVSSDPEGKTVLLRCQGLTQIKEPPGAPLSVTGTTMAPEGQVATLVGCSVRPTDPTGEVVPGEQTKTNGR